MTGHRAVRDRGSASIWLLSCAALVLVVAWVATMRTLAVDARHRAESAADLAALAAAERIGLDGRSCAAAQRIAAANGARLTRCRVGTDVDGRSGTVTVTVRLHFAVSLVGGDVVADARAGRLATDGTT